MRPPRGRGYTLIELLVVCAIIAIIGALALPAFAELLRHSRQQTRVTAFVVSAQVARSAALLRGHGVTLCPSDDGTKCAKDYARGWIVFDDPHGDRERDPDDELLDAYAAPVAGRVVASVLRLTWRGGGRRSTNASITFCDGGDPARSRAVVVSYTGRPRVDKRLPGDKKLPC